VGLAGALLAACAAAPNQNLPMGLERPPVQFSQGRITFTLVDEFGYALSGLRVNMSWDEPTFYKTSAFTNRDGQVSFSGVPSIAEVSVDHPGGLFMQTLHVPQTGRPDVRVMLDTMGGGERMREAERARLSGRQVSSTQ
jgi:hypothetical protein